MEITHKKIAIYPGTFDPITNGHIDILTRSLKLFDEVILLLAVNPQKVATFSAKERMAMLNDVAKQLDPSRVRVDASTGLTVEYAKSHHAIAIVRGLRAVPDFNYEHEIFAGNQFIDPSIEMVFFMANHQHDFISSSMIKQLAKQGVDVSTLVPSLVLTYLEKVKTTSNK